MKQIFNTYCISAALFLVIVLVIGHSFSANSTDTKVTVYETAQFFNMNLNKVESAARNFYKKHFQFTLFAARVQTGVFSEPFKNGFTAWCGTRLKV